MDRRGHSASTRGPGRAGSPVPTPAGVTRPPRRSSRGGEPLSPTRPGARRSTRTSGAGRAAGEPAAIPATVWPTGPDPLDPDAAWPAPLVNTIVTSFTAPGARVVLLATDTTDTTSDTATGDATSRVTTSRAHTDAGVTHPRPTTLDQAALDSTATARPSTTHDHDGELSAAYAAVHQIGRTAVLVSTGTLGSRHGPGTGPVEVDPSTGPTSTAATLAGRGSVPYWADVFTPPTPVAALDDPADIRAADPAPVVSHGPHDGVAQDTGLADLVITSVDPHTPLDDRVGVACARLLRLGGILAVITHSDWSGGRLVDPTGAIVAAAQNADLLYLQHIVALHTPICDGHITPPVRGLRPRRTGRAAAAAPVAHDRAHSDVLVFAQPHDHHGGPDPEPHGDRHREPGTGPDGDRPSVVRSPAADAFDGGVIR